MPEIGSQPMARRVNSVEYHEMSPRQRATAERLRRGPRRGINGPFLAWINAPELADRAEALGSYLRFGSGLPLDLIEITVLATAASWRCTFVFGSHAPLARSAGIEHGDIDSIRLGRQPQNLTNTQRVALDLATAALVAPAVDEHTWGRAHVVFTDAEMANLIGIAGYYGMVCMTVNAYQIGASTDLPAGR